MAQPGQKPLNFISSVPANGATNVSTSLKTMTLTFDKNVIDDSVWANNKKQVDVFIGPSHLNKTTDFHVTRNTAFSQRRNIYLRFLHSLVPNTKYKVVIYPGMKSKAGQTLGKTVILTFTTGKRGTIISGPVQE